MDDYRDTRWDVETPTGTIEDVGAARCEVNGGALVFYDEQERILIAYAPHNWRTVVPQ